MSGVAHCWLLLDAGDRIVGRASSEPDAREAARRGGWAVEACEAYAKRTKEWESR